MNIITTEELDNFVKTQNQDLASLKKDILARVRDSVSPIFTKLFTSLPELKEFSFEVQPSYYDDSNYSFSVDVDYPYINGYDRYDIDCGQVKGKTPKEAAQLKLIQEEVARVLRRMNTDFLKMMVKEEDPGPEYTASVIVSYNPRAGIQITIKE